MATPHVTGLTALVLAHYPDFKNGLKAHNAMRVDRLFQILKDSATPLNLGDPERTGAGVPDSVRALSGEAPRPARTPPGGASPDYIATVLEQLRKAYVAASLL